MDTKTLDETLAVLRKHKVRAASVNPATGELRVEFLLDDVDSILDVSPAVAGAWKQRSVDAETSPYINTEE